VTQAHFLADLDTVLFHAVFFTALLFPAVTAFFWNWWDSAWGVNIVLLEACIAVTLLPGWLFLAFGIDNWALRWVQAVSFAMVGVVIIWRGVLIWRTQAAGARKDGALLLDSPASPPGDA